MAKSRCYTRGATSSGVRIVIGGAGQAALLRDDALEALKAQPQSDPEIQAACMKLAETREESAEDCNNAAWPLVSKPGQPDGDYERGLRLARAACRIEQENVAFLYTLGVALYRSGLIIEAVASLTRSNEQNQQKEPSDLAFLTLAHHRLGQFGTARGTLARLREVMKDPRWVGNQEAVSFLREAETIELDRLFPANPFAP
jgi:tetratricopeptide (TPR) repeat protein